MGWDNNAWGDGTKYNPSGIAANGKIDPLREMIAKLMHAAPGIGDRELADKLYIDMKKDGVDVSFKSGGLINEGGPRGGGKALRGRGTGKMV